MPQDTDELLSTFLDEADEHLAALESGLLRVSDGAPDLELLNAVFRAAHSIKGGSGLFGFEAMTRLTHALEQLLDRLRKGQLPTTRERIDLLLRAVDGLTGLLAAARDGSAAASVLPADIIRELNEAAGVEHRAAAATAPATALAAGPRVYRAAVTPGRHLLTNGMDPLLLLRNLGRKGEVLTVAADLDAIPDLDRIVPTDCYLSWVVTIRSEETADTLKEVFQFVEDDCAVSVTAVADTEDKAGDRGVAGCHAMRREHLADFASAFDRLADWAASRLPALHRAVACSG